MLLVAAAITTSGVLLCVASGAVLAGIVMGIMVGLQWLNDWLEKREMEE
jgi:hypothetical protein